MDRALEYQAFMVVLDQHCGSSKNIHFTRHFSCFVSQFSSESTLRSSTYSVSKYANHWSLCAPLLPSPSTKKGAEEISFVEHQSLQPMELLPPDTFIASNEIILVRPFCFIYKVFKQCIVHEVKYAAFMLNKTVPYIDIK